MSTQLYYSLSNPNQRASNTTPYSDNASFLSQPYRRSPPHQGFGPGGINMYNQQQIQSALYQQQQMEFAQQQAQLEMHLQLEQMRLQNLALQEQIMIGQVQAHQAHAQSQAEQQLHNAYYSANKAPNSVRVTFTQGQGGMLAERALARRQQAEADALYAQCYPNIEEEDDVLRELAHSHQFSVGPDRPNSLTPPAVVVSKPDEAFPLLATPDPLLARGPGHYQPANDAEPRFKVLPDQKPPVSQSQAPPPSLNKSDKSPGRNSPAPSIKKKFSDVVKSSARASSPSNSNAATAAKLNPFSSVFVPGSATTSDQEAVSAAPAAHTSPPPKVVSFNEPEPDSASNPVYRPPRSKSPPSAKVNAPASSTTPAVQHATAALPIRQPRGPAAEAELTNQNFASRIRKRAIKALATRPSNCSSPVSAVSPTNYQYHHQQQVLEALMMQQHPQHALGVAGYLESDLGFHPSMVSPGGIAHFIATARAREERHGYWEPVLYCQAWLLSILPWMSGLLLRLPVGLFFTDFQPIN